MPIYTYECKSCGQKFDLLINVGAGKEEMKCTKCNSKNIKKIFAPFNTVSGNDSSSSQSCPTGTCNLD